MLHAGKRETEPDTASDIRVFEPWFKRARFAPRDRLTWSGPQRGRKMGVMSVGQATFMHLERAVQERARSRSGSPNPTRAHVHPGSRRAGTFEDDFFYSYAQGEPDRLYKQAAELLKRKNAVRRLARAEERELTEDERLATLITNTALRVFKELTTLARTCAGKVFPTWEWIEAAAGVSRASVGRALSALATMGMLEKQP
jgi:hypothetical protein